MRSFSILCLFLLLTLLTGCDSMLPFQNNKLDGGTTVLAHQLEDTQSSKQVQIPVQQKKIDPDHQSYLLKSLTLAATGKVIGCDFAANKNTLEDVKKKYGEPSAKSKDFPYYIYGKQHLDFGVGKDDLIYDIRSHDPKLMKITRSEVVKILGVPNNIKHNTGESIYIYNVNGFQFKLIYVLDKDDPTIHHSSVYSEKAFKKQKEEKKK